MVNCNYCNVLQRISQLIKWRLFIDTLPMRYLEKEILFTFFKWMDIFLPPFHMILFSKVSKNEMPCIVNYMEGNRTTTCQPVSSMHPQYLW